jgi:hypothetical protein
MQESMLPKDHDKDYRRRAKQSILWCSCMGDWRSKVYWHFNFDTPTGLLIFVEEAPSSARKVAGPRAMRSLLGMWGPEMGVCFGKT